MKKYIGMFIIAAVCGSSIADVVTTATFTGRGLVPALGDATDAFQNATITGGSAVHGVTPDPVDMFTSGSPVNFEDVLFADLTGQWVPSVEFSIASPIQLGNLKILLNNDGGAGPVYGRTTVGVWVFASSTPGVFGASELIAEFLYSGDYSSLTGGDHGMEVSIDFTTAPVAEYYRVAFYAGDPDVGARVIEIDGYEAIPEPATLGLVALFGGGVLWIRRTFMI